MSILSIKDSFLKPPRSPQLQLVIEWLTELIREGHMRAGERLPTVRDLAQRYDISFSSARLAVEHLKKVGLVQCIQGSGTYVKSPPQSTTTSPSTVYLFLDSRAHLMGELPHHLTVGLQKARILSINGICQGDRPEQIQHILARWKMEPPKAVVVKGVTTQSIEKSIRESCPPGTRIIATMRHPQLCPTGWHSVNPDYRAAYRIAAQHLLKNGHTRIGLLVKPRIVKPHWPNTLLKAFMWHTEQILAVGLMLREAEIDRGLTIHYNLSVNGDPSAIPTDEENVARMARWLNQPHRPTAVITEDFRFLGLKLAARRAGLRLGEDIAVICVGSQFLSEATDFPHISLGYDLVAQHIVELITKSDDAVDGAARHILVPPTFSATP